MAILLISQLLNYISLIQKNLHKSVIVIDRGGKLLGILSDADIRRALLKGIKLTDQIKKFYNKKFIDLQLEFSNICYYLIFEDIKYLHTAYEYLTKISEKLALVPRHDTVNSLVSLLIHTDTLSLSYY